MEPITIVLLIALCISIYINVELFSIAKELKSEKEELEKYLEGFGGMPDDSGVHIVRDI